MLPMISTMIGRQLGGADFAFSFYFFKNELKPGGQLLREVFMQTAETCRLQTAERYVHLDRCLRDALSSQVADKH